MSRNRIFAVLLAGLIFSGCAPLRLPLFAPPAPTVTSRPASQTLAAATGTPSPIPPGITPSITASTTPTTTPSITPTPTSTPPKAIADSALVYRPSDDGRAVAAVRWSDDGRTLFYALSPAPGGYLLDWFAYDLISNGTRAIRSPNFGFADVWRKVEVGFPRTSDPFSETLGFVSPDYKKAIFPNAGFPDISTNPNYIFVILADNRARQRILGPIFRGTVGRAAWIDTANRVIFDYRYEGRTVIYLADLLKGRTETLFELAGEDTEWRVSPDEKYLLIPQDGRSELIPLAGGKALSLETVGGMGRPEWTRDSRTIYFWAGSENRIISYTLADQTLRALLVRRDLEPFSPLPPVYGMPFSISTDGMRVAFWLENWIWIVELAPTD